MSSSQGSGEQEAQYRCFREWMELQERDLSELRHALDQHTSSSSSLPSASASSDNHSGLKQLIDKVIKHFEGYMDKRSHFARNYVTAYLAPIWCTSLENSLLWIAGCRPSTFIRLVYALSGKQLESHLSEYLQGKRTGNLGELSAMQLTMVNELQRKTIREENRMTNHLASLQERTADYPIAIIAQEMRNQSELNDETEKALDEHANSMVDILEEADQLRMKTLKELVLNILTPFQAVDFLIASKKLHLCMHAWGQKRDHKHGRSTGCPAVS